MILWHSFKLQQLALPRVFSLAPIVRISNVIIWWWSHQDEKRSFFSLTFEHASSVSFVSIAGYSGWGFFNHVNESINFQGSRAFHSSVMRYPSVRARPMEKKGKLKVFHEGHGTVIWFFVSTSRKHINERHVRRFKFWLQIK